MKRLDSLTGVRFFAALLVFGFHGVAYSNNGELDIFGSGMVGVSLFYMLSGFVMAWTARAGDTPHNFYRRRFARIYPAYFAAWLISALILFRKDAFTWIDLVPLTLMQSWVPLEAVYFAGSAVFWSLSCEAFFYLVFPFLHRLIYRLGTWPVVAVGVGAATMSIGAAFLAMQLPANELTRWFIVIFPPLRLMEFVLGVVLGILFSRGFRLRLWPSAAVLIAVTGIYAASFAPYFLSRYAVTLIPFVLLIAALATSDLADRPSPFRWAPIVKLGNWSYAFYLLHAMVLGEVFAIFARIGIYSDETHGLIFWGELIVVLAIAIAAAWMLHRFVETPFERWLRPKRSVIGKAIEADRQIAPSA